MSGFEVDKLEEVRKAVNVCTMCGFCKSVCPSFKAINWDSALSRGRITLTYGLLNGDLEVSDSLVENMYTCTTCADCVRRCPSKVKIVDIIELCRADIVKNGKILPKHKSMCEGILARGNPYGKTASRQETLGRKPHNAKIGYYVGCTATYRSKKTAQATLSILDKLGDDFTTIDEVCCGSVMQRVGWPQEDITPLFQKNVDAIKALGVETLVLACAGCYRMFKIEYPKYVEVPFEVLHITEYLARKDLKLKRMDGVVATYHDPCHLGRHCEVYEPPREVIKKIPGLDFREMKYNRSTSHCCGGGGGVRSAYPEVSLDIANTRLDEAEFADLVITTCPFCVSNLQAAKGDRKVEVRDLVEIIDELME
ncbi:MAG: (Fe-S)-binding protein [Candidatus Methanomethylophilaceae archaeon]|nr:(Fe-S)-binding protein [Candidatus Methanomethylophilaceae archaeon]